MATLTGKTIANTYKDLLQVSNNNGGVDGTLRTVSDGEGTNSPLQLSNSAVNINGTFQLNGATLTATASALNAVTDLNGVTGIVAMSGGSPIGRTITAGAGVSISNGDGVASNPVVALNQTGVVSASYGPFVNLAVNDLGLVVSATTPTSVSVSNFTATKLESTNNLIGVSATFSDKVSAATYFGDGSNLTNLPTAPVSVSAYTVNLLTVVSAATFNGIVSAVAFVGDGSGLTNIAVAFAASATNATNAVNAVSAIFASSATNATNAVSSSFATSATDATNAVNATNATSAVFAASATNATNAVSAVFATSATNATNAINAVSATFATSATDSTNAINAVNATSAVFATSSTDATNAINAINATSAVFATSATNATTAVNVAGGGTVNALSGVFSGIVSVDELDASIGNFVGRVSVGGALNVTGAVSGTSAIFSGDVSIGGLVHIIGKVSASNALFNGMVSVNNFDVNGTATIATATITTGTITTFTATGVSVGASVVCSVLGIGSGATAGQIFGKRLRLNGAAIADIVSLVDAASIAVNFNTAQNFAVMLTGNRTLENPTNCVAGQTGSIFIMQNVSGGKTLSFGSNWKFAAGTAPTLTTTASATDRIDYIVFTSTAIHTVATLDVR